MLVSFTNLKRKYNMDISGVIHIGAHYGEELNEYIENEIREIILFEPLSKNFKVLFDRVRDLNANIQGYQVALGNTKGFATMNLSSNDMQSSSILKPKEHLDHHPDVTFDGQEEVEIDLLDNFDTQGFNFINIDVQGYELEVFKGAAKTLENIDYIYCEVNRGELYENNAMIDEIDEYLNQYGFERKETFWPADWYKWGDALYIKEKK